jgi:hypothetical protein
MPILGVTRRMIGYYRPDAQARVLYAKESEEIKLIYSIFG